MSPFQNNFYINWDHLFYFSGCVLYSTSPKMLAHFAKMAERSCQGLTVSFYFFFKLAIQQWIESDDMNEVEGLCWKPFPVHMNLFPSPWSITSHFWLWLGWRGQSKVSQACRHICFNPAHQSSMPQLFKMFSLISIMKGLIMLMRRPNGLVLSVGDTAVGLQAKSCAKCVT